MTRSPVQVFAMLAASTGDLTTSFGQSGLRQALEAPFARPHEKTYYNDGGIFSRSSTATDTLPSGAINTMDTAWYVLPFGNDPQAVFTINRNQDVTDARAWRIWLACMQADRERAGIKVGQVLAFENRKMLTGEAYQISLSVRDIGNPAAVNVFNSLSVLDRVLQTRSVWPVPALRHA